MAWCMLWSDIYRHQFSFTMYVGLTPTQVVKKDAELSHQSPSYFVR